MSNEYIDPGPMPRERHDRLSGAPEMDEEPGRSICEIAKSFDQDRSILGSAKTSENVATVQSGKLVRICMNMTGELIACYVVPNETTDAQLCRAETMIRESMERYATENEDDFSKFNYAEAFFTALNSAGICVQNPRYYKTIEL